MRKTAKRKNFLALPGKLAIQVTSAENLQEIRNILKAGGY